MGAGLEPVRNLFGCRPIVLSCCSCYNIAMKHTYTKPVFELKCNQCGLIFKTAAANKKLCSPKCRVASISEQFTSTEECWEWPNSRNPVTGYGQLSEWVDGKRFLHTAHRTQAQITFGDSIKGKMVCHKCDNRGCINPSHLFLGTQLDNMRDMISKGRGNQSPPKGEANANAKLTKDAVLVIRSSRLKGSQLASAFGVSQSVISAIKHNKTWKSVKADPQLIGSSPGNMC